jgi:hypothetical protein
MNDQYKKDENILKDIIKQNVKPNDINDELDIIIYYKNMKTKSLIMKNDLTQPTDRYLSV